MLNCPTAVSRVGGVESRLQREGMRMTGLLVSVRSAAEARAALLGGADLIDVKEPLRGSLGAADADRLREISEVVSGQLTLSAAWGEL